MERQESRSGSLSVCPSAAQAIEMRRICGDDDDDDDGNCDENDDDSRMRTMMMVRRRKRGEKVNRKKGIVRWSFAKMDKNAEFCKTLRPF